VASYSLRRASNRLIFGPTFKIEACNWRETSATTIYDVIFSRDINYQTAYTVHSAACSNFAKGLTDPLKIATRICRRNTVILPLKEYEATQVYSFIYADI
jgi:hypothetical protein